jgi:hypothetical protein
MPATDSSVSRTASGRSIEAICLIYHQIFIDRCTTFIFAKLCHRNMRRQLQQLAKRTK